MFRQLRPVFALALIACAPYSHAQQEHPIVEPGTKPATLTLDLKAKRTTVSPMLYGLMTEEINHSYDGGLYAELIQNRCFKDNLTAPVHWSLIQNGTNNAATIQLDIFNPINEALTTCLKLDATKAVGGAGVSNDGFWGIPINPTTPYRASFYAKAKNGGPLHVRLESNDGATVYAQASVPAIGKDWQRYEVTLTTGSNISPSTANRFVIATETPGVYYLNLVSLFPPTYKNHPNGNRIDLMNLLAEMKPKFLRLPGGNYLEGDLVEDRFDWKKTLGPIEKRPGHPGCWKYRSSDGLGLLEFLEWCDDLNIEPVLAVYAGYSLRGVSIKPGPDLEPYVEDALEEIEYVTGDTSTKWGARRARDGHPQPFKLTYVEIGNEDQFDRSNTYDGRFTQFYDAIKKKYPDLLLIASTDGKVKSRTPDLVDDHFYPSSIEMQTMANRYDKRDRNAPKVFVGEWASQDIPAPGTAKGPTPTLSAALGDAAWMIGMERNSDVVAMSCYAPLLVNVNPGGRQWAVNLIGYNALQSFGSPSYYAQKIFAENLGNQVVPMSAKDIPSQSWRNQDVPTLYYGATLATKSGTVFIKLVNTSPKEQEVEIELNGAVNVKAEGQLTEITGNPQDLNTLENPKKVVPKTMTIHNLSPRFKRTLAPNSISVLDLHVN